MKSKGFVTSKFGRLKRDREIIEARIRRINDNIDELLNKAISLARIKMRCQENLVKVNENLSKLEPRLKGEKAIVRDRKAGYDDVERLLEFL